MDDFLLRVGARAGSQLIRNQSVRSRSARSFPSRSPRASVRLTFSSSTTADERVSGSQRSSVDRVFHWAAHLSSCQGTNTQNRLPQPNIFFHKANKICQLCTWMFKLPFVSCYVPLKKPPKIWWSLQFTTTSPLQLPIQILLATFAASLNFNGWCYFSFLFSKLQSSGRRRRWVITLLFFIFYFIRPSLLPVLLKQLESQLSGLTYWHICVPLWHS